MKKFIVTFVSLMLIIVISGCNITSRGEKAERVYTLKTGYRVDGRQGVAYGNGYYIVSGSTTLTRYDENFNEVATNKSPFSEGYEDAVNHIGDVDVYDDEIYCGVELFLDGVASNIMIAVYDAQTLFLKRTFNFDATSGQTECSGIAVNPDQNLVVMCSWSDGDSGRYLYLYDLTSGDYVGKVHMHPVPQYIQGVAYYDGSYYLTADDGDADYDEPDHVYKVTFTENDTECTVEEEYSLVDVTKQGEIEGLTFNGDKKQMLVSYNRGARIILGMPTGFYDGYTEEIHEVFAYDFK